MTNWTLSSCGSASSHSGTAMSSGVLKCFVAYTASGVVVVVVMGVVVVVVLYYGTRALAFPLVV